mmetsp:Transcript_29727/g.102389  ORF Transcript_29727/g.102389 Transcript_29727/m.102389 type:complete len:272 (+) Transcript_29727:593-1408(+)
MRADGVGQDGRVPSAPHRRRFKAARSRRRDEAARDARAARGPGIGADARAGGADCARVHEAHFPRPGVAEQLVRLRLRRRQRRPAARENGPRRRDIGRDAGQAAGLFGPRPRLVERGPLPRPRRGGPHARHGLRAPNPQGRGQVPRRPPDAVLHRDVAARGAQAGVGVSGQPRRDLRRRHFGRFKSQQGRDAKRVRHGRPRHVHEGPPLSGRGPPRDAGQRRDVRRPVPHHHLLQRQAPVRHAGAAAAAAGRHALRGHARRQGPDAADSDD